MTLKSTRSNIIVHEDLLSGVTGGHAGEAEYILLGGKREIKLKDVFFEGKPK